jgi:hypothetical protein
MKYGLLLTGVALLAAGAVCAGGSPKLKFIAVGDSRGASEQINTEILTELAGEITNQRPAFVLFAGDLVYTGDLSTFQDWTNIMAPVYNAGIRIYPIMGSHDTNDVGAYLQVFGQAIPGNGPPGEIGRTYTVACSNVLILALDNNVHPDQVNQPWIDSVLATNTLPHVFAMGHQPAFKVYHTSCLDTHPAARDAFWRSLGNARCRVYFSGHEHFYDHTRLDDGDANTSNDIHQVIVGTAGAPPNPDGPYDGANDFWTPVRIWHEEQNGYVVVEVEGLDVNVTWWHRVAPGSYASTADAFAYTASPLPIFLACTFTEGQLTLTWLAGMLQTATNAIGPYGDVSGASSPHVITNLVDRQRFFRVRSN